MVGETTGRMVVTMRGEAAIIEGGEVIKGMVVETGALSSEKNGWVSSRLGDECGTMYEVRGDWLLGVWMEDGGWRSENENDGGCCWERRRLVSNSVTRRGGEVWNRVSSNEVDESVDGLGWGRAGRAGVDVNGGDEK